ncbi:hypothetical protein BLL52_2173 [Rhodoferax antarcticus ANT.BR]|uniref:Uncharacterized protein n=1 Tax=Rhodoferax antarcticus ANT.BR TaxID=1111071 RepID=A0A1Q8YD26_9BURK|nr:hypothetical protein BLL52_2173 [Rhodoferax antarcticus ANT.BR]
MLSICSGAVFDKGTTLMKLRRNRSDVTACYRLNIRECLNSAYWQF